MPNKQYISDFPEHDLERILLAFFQGVSAVLEGERFAIKKGWSGWTASLVSSYLVLYKYLHCNSKGKPLGKVRDSDQTKQVH